MVFLAGPRQVAKTTLARQILTDLLVGRAASLLSLNSLRGDLEVNHKAVAHWVEILDRLHHVFRVPPYDVRPLRSLRKMPKVYAWDASLVSGEAAREVARGIQKLIAKWDATERSNARRCER